MAIAWDMLRSLLWIAFELVSCQEYHRTTIVRCAWHWDDKQLKLSYQGWNRGSVELPFYFLQLELVQFLHRLLRVPIPLPYRYYWCGGQWMLVRLELFNHLRLFSQTVSFYMRTSTYAYPVTVWYMIIWLFSFMLFRHFSMFFVVEDSTHHHFILSASVIKSAEIFFNKYFSCIF